MKRKTISILICLALMSLACLQTAMVANAPSEIATQTVAIRENTITPTTPTHETPAQICARVIAAQSVNLRSGPSEHAQWLMWLLRGDLVRVVDQSNADWWKVEIDDVTGYVRSAYVGERECEQ